MCVSFRAALTASLPKLEPYQGPKEIPKEIIGTGREEFLKRQSMFTQKETANESARTRDASVAKPNLEEHKETPEMAEGQSNVVKDELLDDILPGKLEM